MFSKRLLSESFLDIVLGGVFLDAKEIVKFLGVNILLRATASERMFILIISAREAPAEGAEWETTTEHLFKYTKETRDFKEPLPRF